MERNCLKCGTPNVDAIGSELEACPKCGAIYSRVEAARSAKVTPPKGVALSPPARSKTPLLKIAIVVIALGFAGWGIAEWKARAQAEQDRLAAERARAEKQVAEEKRAAEAFQERERRIAQFEAEVEALSDVRSRWSGTVTIAGNTGRIALSGPLMRMQELEREATGLQLNPCLDRARDNLALSMSVTIHGFVQFMGDSDYSPASEFDRAAELAKQIGAHIQRCESEARAPIE